MKRLILIAALVSACSCSHAPVASAEHDLGVIKAAYVQDLHDQTIYCNTHLSCNAVRTAGYNASASLLTAEGEQTDSTIAKARADVAAFTQALRDE